MKKLKLIVALTAGLFAFTSVNAGEMTVSGSMHVTYQSEQNNVTGNPLGMNTDLTFAGSTDTDFGTASFSLATDGTFVGESGADHTYSLATGMGTFRVANNGDAANAVDDIMPSAWEEANGSGSGSYATDFGSGMDGSMSLGYANGDVMGTGISVNYTYYPRLDATTNNEKAASGDDEGTSKSRSAQSINIGIPLDITGVAGAKLTLGAEEADNVVASADAKEGVTGALVVPFGNVKVGYQKKVYQAAQALGAKTFYKDDIIGIAVAVNDDLAISYGVMESQEMANDGKNDEQETKSINIAYTVGGLTLAFADAKTANSGYADGTDNDTRTISIRTAF